MATTTKKGEISIVSNNEKSNLATIFSKVSKVYYYSSAITKTNLGTGVACDCEFPIIQGSVNFNTGDTSVTEVKLTDGTIWTSMADKGDSDISMQIASLNDKIAGYFLNKRSSADLDDIKVFGSTNAFDGKAYNLEVKKLTGSLILTDDSGETVIILPSVDMFGSLVAGEGDNPSYFNAKVTPKTNADGVALYLLEKTSDTFSA